VEKENLPTWKLYIASDESILEVYN